MACSHGTEADVPCFACEREGTHDPLPLWQLTPGQRLALHGAALRWLDAHGYREAAARLGEALRTGRVG